MGRAVRSDLLRFRATGTRTPALDLIQFVGCLVHKFQCMASYPVSGMATTAANRSLSWAMLPSRSISRRDPLLGVMIALAEDGYDGR
jgi:hypothetical protein